MPLLFGNDVFFREEVRRRSASSSNSYVHVLLHSTNGDSAHDKHAVQVREPFQLSDDLWICRLPSDLRDVVYETCEAPGFPKQRVFRQYGQLYAIAHFAGPWTVGQLSGWDAQGKITEFITFSQLVHPTSIGFGNSARFTFGPAGEFICADPGPCRGITEQAFTIPHHRNWISEAECEQIKRLLSTSKLGDLPDRVARANWNVQHAVYQYFFEVRTLLVVTGLEALLHTRSSNRRDRAGAQFKTRTALLAQVLGVPFTRDDASAVWEHRSDVTHGRDPWASRRSVGQKLKQPPELTKQDETVRRCLQAEELLRASVLRCLTDPQFAKKFISDASVEGAFPI